MNSEFYGHWKSFTLSFTWYAQSSDEWTHHMFIIWYFSMLYICTAAIILNSFLANFFHFQFIYIYKIVISCNMFYKQPTNMYKKGSYFCTYFYTQDIWEHWTAVLTLLGLISSVYRNLHYWGSNQQPQIAISSGGDYGIHCWGDLIRSKQLSSVPVRRAYMFGGFSGHGNSIHKGSYCFHDH